MFTISQEYLKDFFDYKDGNLIRKKSIFSSKIGSIVGGFHKKNGYIRTTINKKEFLLHRLIYLYHYGVLKDGLEIDHINGNKTDNRIENLRMVTRQHNQWNRKKDKDIVGIVMLKNLRHISIWIIRLLG